MTLVGESFIMKKARQLTIFIYNYIKKIFKISIKNLFWTDREEQSTGICCLKRIRIKSRLR